ncbi:MOSC domain-containing protein [Chloroflexota bacterium]
MSRIIAVSTSKNKGEKKVNVEECLLKVDYGVVDDAHADSETHRQVSLLAIESIAKMRDMGFPVEPGDFAENLTTEDVDLVSSPLGTRLSVGKDVILEVTQIGKECHSGCAIFRQVGKCIMPKEGIFARVIHGGTIRAGDTIMQSE